jgi:hypothetical protein
MKFEFDTASITGFVKKAAESAKNMASDIAEAASDKVDDIKEATAEKLGDIKEKLETKNEK